MGASPESMEFLADFNEYNDLRKGLGKPELSIAEYRKARESIDFQGRLFLIHDEIELADNFKLYIGRDEESEGGRRYFQIHCYRKDVITGEMGWGQGGKGYLSPHMTKNELVQIVFGLYKGYWEHEARESFKYRGRRVFGPHMDVDAIWTVARKVDVRSAKHVEDRDG